MNLRSARSRIANGPIRHIVPPPQLQKHATARWLRKVLSRCLIAGLILGLASIASVSLDAQQAPPPYPPQAYPQNAYPQQQTPYGTPQAPPYGQQMQPAYPQAGYRQENQDEAPPPPDAQDEYAPAQAQPQGLSPDQLDQLVAPIALYPDALLAQVLAASTYPDQVADAAQWIQAQAGAPPQQIAYTANAQPWDPSVKALTAFPQVLAEMAQNLQWTTELGNAYYNQPQDVFAAVQDLRQRAEAAGTLENTPQETVSNNQGYIQLAPANPQVVYVPGYNPWSAYGQPIAPYPGFSLLSSLGDFIGPAMHFGMGMVMNAFMPMSWGWLGWGLNWLGHLLTFDNGGYYSHSSSLVDWGLPYGGPRAWRGGYGRGDRRGYEAGRGAGYGWRSGARYQSARAEYRDQRYGQRGFAGDARRDGYDGRSARTYQGIARMPAFNARPQSYGRAGAQYGRPAPYNSGWNDRERQSWNSGARGNESWARTQMPSRGYDGSQRFATRNERAYARAPRSAFGESGFRSSGYGRDSFGARSGFGNSAYGRNSFGGQSEFGSSGHGRSSFWGGRSSRGFSRSSQRSWKPGKMRGFDGGHASRGFGGGGHFRAPKMSHHGGGHSGGHGGRHRR